MLGLFLWALLWLGAVSLVGAQPVSPADTFGIERLYPSLSGTREWNSAHWANGRARTLKYAPDPDDPTGWTEDHSGSSDGFRIDGQGTMTLSGGSPRFHVNSMITSEKAKVPAQFYRNVEFTAYAMSLSAGGANYGGMVVGLRSGPLGHASAGGDDCDATTYYARFRNDGKWDFEKELKHPGSTYRSGSGLNKQDPLWGGAKLPRYRWIGMKFVVRDVMKGVVQGAVDGATGRSTDRATSAIRAVKLELYIDSTSGGNFAAAGRVAKSGSATGGVWQKVGEALDDGAWPSGDVSGCAYAQNSLISPGNGIVLWRTDGDTVQYKYVSVREIAPVVLADSVSDSTTALRMRRKHGQPTLPSRRRHFHRAELPDRTIQGREIR